MPSFTLKIHNWLIFFLKDADQQEIQPKKLSVRELARKFEKKTPQNSNPISPVKPLEYQSNLLNPPTDEYSKFNPKKLNPEKLNAALEPIKISEMIQNLCF